MIAVVGCVTDVALNEVEGYFAQAVHPSRLQMKLQLLVQERLDMGHVLAGM